MTNEQRQAWPENEADRAEIVNYMVSHQDLSEVEAHEWVRGTAERFSEIKGRFAPSIAQAKKGQICALIVSGALILAEVDDVDHDGFIWSAKRAPAGPALQGHGRDFQKAMVIGENRQDAARSLWRRQPKAQWSSADELRAAIEQEPAPQTAP